MHGTFESKEDLESNRRRAPEGGWGLIIAIEFDALKIRRDLVSGCN